MLLQPWPDNAAGGVVIYIDSALSYSHNLLPLNTAELINVNFNLNHRYVNFKFANYGIYITVNFIIINLNMNLQIH